MMRRRAGPPPSADNDDDSSSDEDVFAKLSRQQAKKKQKRNLPAPRQQTNSTETAAPTIMEPAVSTKQPNGSTTAPAAVPSPAAAAASASANPALPLTTTSSMKRHHKEISGTRKAKMDALLQELEQEKHKSSIGDYPSSSRGGRDRVPVKKGSYVEPGQEHITTNLFVGNLAPTLGEEEVTNLFRQFGDLYSVKIMWPRTAEERARERHTGFVCFMNRQDAEEAMTYCDNADPFNVGRRLVMRWGKNVKKAGGVTPIRKRAALTQPEQQPSQTSSRHPVYDPDRHSKSAIRVTIPPSEERARFISIVASYVAKDGSALERLLEEEVNPQFSFLRLPLNPTQTQREEHIYYRWRVYSLAIGDGFYSWRTEPFVMLRPHGCFWIPPIMDAEQLALAQQEQEHKRQEEQRLKRAKEERTARRGYVTGRQLERGKGGPDGGRRLSQEEMDQFQVLFRQKLSISRESICVAMAFCFEKGGAARQIADMLKDLLMEERVGIDTRVARLYLLSDILFNSQQPGVKNAFLYRDSVERYAPDIFASLGKDKGGGRISQNKLATAVSRVLAAWTSWSVYPPYFLDQLQDTFEGKEIDAKQVVQEEVMSEEADETTDDDPVIAPNDADLVSTRQKGEWKEIDHSEETEAALNTKHSKPEATLRDQLMDAEPKEPIDFIEQTKLAYRTPSEVDQERIDPDGEPLDADGESIDADGYPLELDDPDGKPLDPDGEPVDADGEPL